MYLKMLSIFAILSIIVVLPVMGLSGISKINPPDPVSSITSPSVNPVSSPDFKGEDIVNFRENYAEKSITNLVSNGNFESPVISSLYVSYPKGKKLGKWLVKSGDIELIRGYWKSASGKQSIDLSGVSRGTITQSIPTTKGKRYQLSFYIAANPVSGSIKIMKVYWGSKKIGTYTAKPISLTKMGWKKVVVKNLLATSSSTLLKFVDISEGSPYNGMALDNVQIIKI